MANGATGAQRALWTFLLYTLVGPLFGGLAVAALLILAPALGLATLLPIGLPPLGQAVLATYVWCALPCGLAALLLLPAVWRRGRFGALEAAAAGIVAFVVMSQLFPIPHQGMTPVMAVIAGVLSVLLRFVLLRATVLNPEDAV